MANVSSLGAEPVGGRRRATRNRIYRYLYEAETPRTKLDISRDLAVSMPTVHQNLTELLEAGLVEHGATRKSTGGRPATGLTAAANLRYAVGVALSDHRFTFMAVNLKMEEIAYHQTGNIPLAELTGSGARLAAELAAFLARFGLNPGKLLGVGLAVPGILDAAGSQVLFAPTMGLRGKSVDAWIEHIPYPTFVCNDATAGGYAEWLATGSREDMAYLSLENGVGGAVFLNGAPYGGQNGRSAEFGHLCVVPGGRPCQCGKRGCLEAYCSAARLSDDLGITLEAFFAGLAAHDPAREALWQEYLDHLATAIGNLHMILDCPLLLGGALTAYLPPYLPALRARLAAQGGFDADAGYLALGRYPRRAIPLGVALHFIRDFIDGV